MNFCNIVSSNIHDSLVHYVRCKLATFTCAYDDTNLFKNRQIPVQQSHHIKSGTVSVNVSKSVSFNVPVNVCLHGVRRFKHQFGARAHQTALLRYLTPEFLHSGFGTFLVYWTMGSGKTKGVLNALRYVKHLNTIIIICPKSCVHQWAKEISSLPFLSDSDKDNLTLYTIMCEAQLRSELRHDSNLLKNKIVIFDEIHQLRNNTPEGIKVVDALSTARLRICLTGTPLVNTADEIEYLLRLAQIKVPVKNSFETFQSVYKDRVHFYDPCQYLKDVTPISKTSNQMKVIEPIKVEMTLLQTFHYFTARSSNIEFGNFKIQSSARNSYDVKRKVISSYFDAKNCPKILALVHQIKKITFPQIVHSRYIEKGLRPIYEELCKHFTNVAMFDGSTCNKDRDQLIKDYNRQKINILLISDAGALGLSLLWSQGIHLLFPFENQSSKNQCIGRCVRLNSHTGIPPRSDMRPYVTVVTYLSTFKRNFNKSEVKQLYTSLHQSNNYLVSLYPENECVDVLYSFLHTNMKQDQYKTIDEKVFNSCDNKQNSIDAALSVIQSVGIDKKLQSYLSRKVKEKKRSTM